MIMVVFVAFYSILTGVLISGDWGPPSWELVEFLISGGLVFIICFVFPQCSGYGSQFHIPGPTLIKQKSKSSLVDSGGFMGLLVFWWITLCDSVRLYP